MTPPYPRPLLLALAALAAAAASARPTQRSGDAAGRPAVAVETARAATDLEQEVEVGVLSARSVADVRTEASGTVAEVPSRSGCR